MASDTRDAIRRAAAKLDARTAPAGGIDMEKARRDHEAERQIRERHLTEQKAIIDARAESAKAKVRAMFVSWRQQDEEVRRGR